MDPVDLALRLTLLELLLRPVGPFWLRPAALALAGAGLVLPGLLRRRWLWATLALLSAVRVIADWPLADNHAYLLCYWCTAVFLAHQVEDTREALAFDGRFLIGLVFAFATLWKLVLSPDFLDATFFRITLLTDDRFAGFARLAGGLSPEQLAGAREALGRHVDGFVLDASGVPPLPERFDLLARAITFASLATEAAVAVAFLSPAGSRVHRARDALLLFFCATTYAVATVEGFGWLLVVMGVAQCEPGRRATRWLYLAAFALILLYREVPFASLLLDR